MSKSSGLLLNAVIVIVAIAGAAILSGFASIDEILPMVGIAGLMLGLVLYISNWYTTKKAEMYQ